MRKCSNLKRFLSFHFVELDIETGLDHYSNLTLQYVLMWGNWTPHCLNILTGFFLIIINALNLIRPNDINYLFCISYLCTCHSVIVDKNCKHIIEKTNTCLSCDVLSCKQYHIDQIDMTQNKHNLTALL